jgi:hypothetical protein
MTAQIIQFRPRTRSVMDENPMVTGYLVGLAICGLMAVMVINSFGAPAYVAPDTDPA